MFEHYKLKTVEEVNKLPLCPCSEGSIILDLCQIKSFILIACLGKMTFTDFFVWRFPCWRQKVCLSSPSSNKGYIVFAIGFADADYGELVSIASKPSDRHVFFVDDLDAFQKIEEKLVTFVCEAATASEFPPAHSFRSAA